MRIALLLLFSLLMVASALAEEGPRPDEIRVILPLPGKSTSDCIGRQHTPLCGVETLIGCAGYVWNKACIKNIRVIPEESLNRRIEYVFREYGYVNRKLVKQINREDYERGGFGNYPWLTVNAFQARLWERYCHGSSPNCDHVEWMDTMYTVSILRGRWTFSMYGLYKEKNWFVEKPIFVHK